MNKNEYATKLYSGTQTVAETLFGERIDIDEKLSTKFGIDSYPLEESSEDTATRQYHRISHGLSYLVADEYSTFYLTDFRIKVCILYQVSLAN